MGQIDHEKAQFSAPEKLTTSDAFSQFECGESSLDYWLKRRAIPNEETGAWRTYVLRVGQEIAGYYALATGAISHAEATGKIRRKPDPVPVITLGRLAIASKFKGRGIGTAFLRDAVLRVLQAAEIADIRAILVHAISDQAKHFYEKHGFVPSPADPMTLMITVAEALRILGA